MQAESLSDVLDAPRPAALGAYFVSTALLYHGAFVVNSLAHVIARRRFETKNDSKNGFLIALVTLGEGWRNKHHIYTLANAARPSET